MRLPICAVKFRRLNYSSVKFSTKSLNVVSNNKNTNSTASTKTMLMTWYRCPATAAVYQ